MKPTDKQAHILLGAYVLGALSDQDHSAFTAHLLSCTMCRAELDELAGLRRLLDLLEPADVEAVVRSCRPGTPPAGGVRRQRLPSSDLHGLSGGTDGRLGFP